MGSQRPKITAASAMKPAPAVISLPKPGADTSVKYAPPRPATAPASETFQNRVPVTLMPTVSAAFGCSPTDRRRRPQRVWNRPNHTAKIAMYIRYTISDWLNSTGPTIGMSLRNGIGNRDRDAAVR